MRMIYSVAAIVIAALTTLTTVAAAEPPGLRREIEQVNRAMETALGRGDLIAVARFYADDAQIMDGKTVVRGRADLDAYWTRIKNARSWKLDVIEVGGSKNEPWQLGRSTLVSGAAGQERTSVVDFIVLWRRQPDGKLKIYVDMYVSAPKPKA